jgi:hypothetical protein
MNTNRTTLTLPKKADNPFKEFKGKNVFIQRGVVGYEGFFESFDGVWLVMRNCQIHGTKTTVIQDRVVIHLNLSQLNHIHEVV